VIAARLGVLYLAHAMAEEELRRLYSSASWHLDQARELSLIADEQESHLQACAYRAASVTHAGKAELYKPAIASQTEQLAAIKAEIVRANGELTVPFRLPEAQAEGMSETMEHTV
jgi:hypothetical protein